MSGRGVIYLVTGARSYLGELSTSLRSLRRHEPDLPVTVFSPFSVPARFRCDVVPYPSDLHPLQQKVAVLAESPYDETLFIDTDTTILGPVSPVFECLGQADFAVAKSYDADWDAGEHSRFRAMVHPSEYNTGVLLFRTDDTGVRTFLTTWRQAVLGQDPLDMWPGHNCDQTYFNRLTAAEAPLQAGLRFGELDNTVWNVRGPMAGELRRTGRWGEVRIFHYRTRAMKARQLVYSASDPSFYRRLASRARRMLARRGT